MGYNAYNGEREDGRQRPPAWQQPRRPDFTNQSGSRPLPPPAVPGQFRDDGRNRDNGRREYTPPPDQGFSRYDALWQQRDDSARLGPSFGQAERGYQQPPHRSHQWQPGPYPQQAAQFRQPRQKHTARNILVALGGFVILIIGIAVAANSGHTVQTSGSIGVSTGTGTKNATVGTAISLVGDGSGEQMSVTVVKVISDAQSGDEFSGPDSGDRLYAVQFRLSNTGSAAYSDAPENSAVVVDASGQSYQSSLDNAAGCTSFGGTENIAPGDSGLGCIVFEVPEGATISKVQFTLDSGMGPATGQWSVS